MPIKDRPDERYSRSFDTSRRMPKRFRHFPNIVVQPPENEVETTSSMPDIHSFLKKNSLKKPSFRNISETNSSCPDLRDESFYGDSSRQFDNDSVASMEVEDVFEEYDDFSENVSVCSESYHDSEPDSCRSNDTEFSHSKQKVTLRPSRRRRKEEQPTEVLRKNLKFKHSTSLGILPGRHKNEIDPNHDSYYTVHGGNNLTHHSPSAFSNYRHFDYPPSSYSNNNVLRTNYGSVDRIRGHTQYSIVPSYPPENTFYTRTNSSAYNSLSKAHNIFNKMNETEIMNKCCCGGVKCKKVVPIFDYLETYFVKTVRFLFCIKNPPLQKDIVMML